MADRVESSFWTSGSGKGPGILTTNFGQTNKKEEELRPYNERPTTRVRRALVFQRLLYGRRIMWVQASGYYGSNS
jgi:hypothetical protein